MIGNDAGRVETAATRGEGKNRCNPIEILWECSCTAGGIYKRNLYGGIERNRSLMPSRRFLAVDLEAHSRMLTLVGEADRYRRPFASFRRVAAEIVTSRDFANYYHRDYHRCTIYRVRKAVISTLTGLQRDYFRACIFSKGEEGRLVLVDQWRPRDRPAP